PPCQNSLYPRRNKELTNRLEGPALVALRAPHPHIFMPMRFLITGATGFIGGHISEACVNRGWQVVAIARPPSDTALLDKIGAAVLKGELDDPQLIHRAMEEVDVVVHCAGKVGNWGPVEDYRPLNVEALRNLLEACKGHALSRFVHLSSL